MKEQGKDSNTTSKKKITQPILIIIGLILFKSFIWDVYIVNPTVEAALDGLDGEAGVGMFVDDDEKANMTIRPFEDGFKVYGISKGYWGWSVTDEVFIKHHEGSKSFEVTEKTFHYKQKKDVAILLITTQDKRIDPIIADSKHTGEINFDRISNGDTRLYYIYSKKPLGEVTYEAFSKDGGVLYKQ